MLDAGKGLLGLPSRLVHCGHQVIDAVVLFPVLALGRRNVILELTLLALDLIDLGPKDVALVRKIRALL